MRMETGFCSGFVHFVLLNEVKTGGKYRFRWCVFVESWKLDFFFIMMDEKTMGDIASADQSQSLNERERERDRDRDVTHYPHVWTLKSSKSSEVADVWFSDIKSSATLYSKSICIGPSLDIRKHCLIQSNTGSFMKGFVFTWKTEDRRLFMPF